MDELLTILVILLLIWNIVLSYFIIQLQDEKEKKFINNLRGK